MKLRKHFIAVVLLCGIYGLVLTGCGSTPAKFYVLSAMDNSEIGNTENLDIAIGLHNLNFTGYLEKPQIVTKTSDNELKVDDFNRWGEPLEENFERIIVENLAVLIPTDKIYLINLEQQEENIYFLTAEITKFELGPGNTVTLDVRWRVSDKIENDYHIDRRNVYQRTVKQTDYSSVVAAMSEVAGDFSIDVAAEIKSQYKMRK